MDINFSLLPVTIRLSKYDGYGISMLGIKWRGSEFAIGFNFINHDNNDCDILSLNVYFYGWRKLNIIVRAIKKSHYICADCGTPVNTNNHYCFVCLEYKSDSDIIWFDIKNKILK